MERLKGNLLFHLLEASGKEGTEWEVALIQPGLSKNGTFYTREVLEKATKLFDDAPSYAYQLAPNYYSHQPDSTRDVTSHGLLRHLVGWFTGARYGKFKDAKGNQKEGIIAKWHIAKNAKWLKELLKDAWERGKKNLLELSIDAQGPVNRIVKNGKEILAVEKINSVSSVDPVTRGAAGGELVRLVASLDDYKEDLKMDWKKQLVDFCREIDPALIEGVEIEDIQDEQVLSLSDCLSTHKEAAETFRERMGFYTQMLDSLMDMLNQKKIEEAKRIINQMKDKLATYGYGYPPNKDVSKPQELSNVSPGPETVPAKKQKEQQKEKEKEKREEEKMTEELKKRECAILLKEKLLEDDLPPVIKEKLKKQFGEKIFTEQELTEAIAEEKKVLAALTESGEVKGLGNKNIEVGQNEKDHLRKAMYGMMEGEDVDGVPRFTSLHESLRKVTGFSGSPVDIADRLRQEIAFALPGNANRDFESHHRMLKESQSLRRLTEDLATSDWAQYFGDSCRRAMIKEYSRKPYTEWRKIVSDITSVPDFRTNRRLRVGGFTDLNTVTEGNPYTELANPSDEEQTYSIAKRGNVFTITYETLVNDDLGKLRRLPLMLGRAAGRTLHRFVFDLIKNNPTMGYDSKPLFDAAHFNTDVNELTYDNLVLANDGIRKQGELDSGDRLGNPGKYILIPIDLDATADEVLGLVKRTNSEDATVESAIRKFGMDPIVVDYWTDENDWFLVANPKDMPTIEMGFLGGKESPEMFVADQPTVGSAFTNDKIVYKIRHIYGGNVLDHRSFYGNFVP